MFERINIFYEPLPESVSINNKEYGIITDFREWIRFTDMLRDKKVPSGVKELLALHMFDEPQKLSDVSMREIIFAFMDFLSCKPCEQTIASGDEQSDPVERGPEILSYKIDAPYIIAGFLQCYGIDLLEIPYMHWWKFKMLFDGLNEETTIKKMVYYRSVDLSEIKDKEERKRIRKIQQRIALPQEIMSDEEIANVFA